MIQRSRYIKNIQEAFDVFPICALLGPRQCGKTTLARHFKEHVNISHHFDLEDPTDQSRLATPKLALENLSGFIIIDEIQRNPDLFQYLRVLVDTNKNVKLLVLGSASRDLIHQSSETLAGRIQYIPMTPLQLGEGNVSSKLWLRGGFPLSYLAQSDRKSFVWRKAYISTFLERDMATLGFNLSPQMMRKLWIMVAHYHANLINYSELSRSLCVCDKTIKRYIDILDTSFMVRQLQPWHTNIGKRQIKRPKIYIRDSGLLHTLLGLHGSDVYTHPKVGASWEGFALETIIYTIGAEDEDCYFWRTQAGAELDLFVMKDGKRYGYEFKYTDRPSISKSMHAALHDLELDSLTVVIPGQSFFSMHQRIVVKGLDSKKFLIS